MLDFIPIPTWRDFADIAFLTIVAYYLYVWFRGSRALRVLIGLVVLGGVYSLAKLWGLFLTTWVFQILWQVLIILLLILFQSEIRQVLERVSSLRRLRPHRRPIEDAFVHELATVSFDLARSKTGALMVLARDHDPSEFLTGGHTIMALPDPILIKSIFDRHTPSHDGAIVFSRGQLTQLGAILPLTTRDNIPDQFGTRHRAALGLCEHTDAVCIVVSEERAEVSTVEGDSIKVWKDPHTLSAALEKMLRMSEQPPRPAFKDMLKEALRKNLGLKLTALAVVTLAWMVLANPQEVSVNVTAPVRFENLSSELAVEDTSAKEVRLTLAGRRNSVRGLTDKDIRVHLDLGALTIGTHLVRISDNDVDLPLGLSITRVIPQNVLIVLKTSGAPAPDSVPAVRR